MFLFISNTITEDCVLGIRRRLVNMLNGLFERYKHIACSGHLNFKINVLPTRNMVCASQKTRLFEKFGREAFLDRSFECQEVAITLLMFHVKCQRAPRG